MSSKFLQHGFSVTVQKQASVRQAAPRAVVKRVPCSRSVLRGDASYQSPSLRRQATRATEQLPLSSLRPYSGARQRLATCASSSNLDASSAASTSAQNSVDYFKTDSRPVILFDGVCNLCNGGVNFVLDWDPKSRVRFAALQSAAGRRLLQQAGRDPDDISSIVLVAPDQAWIKSEAVLRIAQYLELPLPALAQLAMFFPLAVRDPVYDQVAANRYGFFGKADSCRVSDASFADRFLE